MRIVKGRIRISEVIIKHKRDHFSKAECAERCKDWFMSGDGVFDKAIPSKSAVFSGFLVESFLIAVIYFFICVPFSQKSKESRGS